MNIVVLVKDVPDTYGERHLSLETGLVDRGGTERVLDEICERALEAALTLAESQDGVEVHAVMMGDEASTVSLRKALAMGAKGALRIGDEALLGADAALTGEVLAAALGTMNPDLVLAGNLSTDGNTGIVPAVVAERLGWPLLNNVREISVDGRTVNAVAAADDVERQLQAELPAVVTVSEQAPDPRFPNFKGVMAAKKAPVETSTLADLGIDVEADVPRSIVVAADQRPPRAAGTVIHDDDTAIAQLADFLSANRLI